MFDVHQREKLLNAIIFFVRETRRCHTLKLFKLLNFLDFEHYRLTGVGVTGLSYKAWPQGPAPAELWHELPNPAPDLRRAIAVLPITDDITNEILRRDIKAKAAFDQDYFSRRELEIMRQLAEIFMEADGATMSAFSHSKNLPWNKVYGKGEGKGRVIPYELARTSEPILQTLETLPESDHQYRKHVFASE